MFAVAIHFTLVFLISPVTSRMGTDQSWKEVVFMSYSGLREAAVSHAAPGEEDTEIAAVLCSLSQPGTQGAPEGLLGFSLGAD